jgi:hypothetical protein
MAVVATIALVGIGPIGPARGAAVDGAGQRYGFNDNSLWNPEVPRNAYLSKLQDAGAKYLRSGINWQWYEPQYKVYNSSFWSIYDRNYADALAVGARQIIILMGTPYWALTADGRGATSPDGTTFRCQSDNGAQCFAPPDVDRADVRAEWQAFVTKVALRYPKAAAIEVWNEPYIQWFWLQRQTPALYGRLLAATAQAIRQANPAMLVLSGSTSNFQGPDTTWNTAEDSFLRTVYAVAGKASFDAIGWHSYPCNFSWEGPTTQLLRDIKKVRAVRHEFADDATPLWMTEVGATTGGGSAGGCGGGQFTESEQASVLGKALDWAKGQNARNHDLPVVVVHTLLNPKPRAILGVSNGDGEGEYGIVAYSYNAATHKTRFRDKPAYPVVRCKIRLTC